MDSISAPRRKIMNLEFLRIGLAALALALLVVRPAAGAEDDPPPPPSNRPNPDELRNRMRNLSPEERETRLREWRARLGGATNRSELEKRREELRRLSPAER